jgi:integrase
LENIVPRKRADGEGTISKRPDGRWQGQISLGYKLDGTRNRKTVYGRTQKEVRQKLDQLKYQVASGDYTSNNMTVAEYLEHWHREKSRNWKARTVELYKHNIRHSINPVLGHLKLSTLSPLHVQCMVGEIADSGRVRTANMCRSLLYSALKQAIRWGYITRNVVEAVDPLKEEPKEPELWTPKQTMQFLEVISSHRLYAAFYLLITTGLRRGELLGLRWEDVQGDSLRVEQSLTLVGNDPVLSTPKTKRGRRRVGIALDVQHELLKHKQRQEAERAFLGASWTDTGLAFVSEIGTAVHPRNFSRTWYRLQEQAGLPRARIHDLRHLHISLLIWRGFDAKTIADRVGHTDPAFTLRRYTHLFEAQRRQAALSMLDLLQLGTDEGVEKVGDGVSNE